ncbi:MAG: 5-formyltetrahydrofolate cyclo-ligase [Alphaproteobacteria bacterium]|nr:5-formyltetrahydrofolate cyclo-ligase [Alphaproteobacteria bacterium]
MSITDEKAATRIRAYGRRKEVHDSGLDPQAAAHLTEYLTTLEPFDLISAYMPIRTEISPLEVMTALHIAGKTVLVPVIKAKGQPLLFSRWSPDGAMVRGPFGAYIPAVEAYFAPEVLITPLLAYDARGYRLGYGGGFYDRSFQKLRQNKPITAVGFAYSAQQVEAVPTEPTDQRLDAIVTEAGVLTL